jgi:hypothetical protein
MVRHPREDLAQSIFLDAKAKALLEHRCGLLEQYYLEPRANSADVQRRSIHSQGGLAHN